MARWSNRALLLTVAFAVVLVLLVGPGFSRHALAGLEAPQSEEPKEKKGKKERKKEKAKQAEAEQERLERGRYLIEGPMHCFACHSDVDWKAPGAPILPEKKGAGARAPAESVPFPLYAPNITPDRETGAGTWTDEQFARAIREGIGHDGRRLLPAMPYMNFRVLSDDDLAAVIAYLRSVPPVRNALPNAPVPEPVLKSLPPPEPITAPVPTPDFTNPIKRGSYLVMLANCGGCHTPLDQQGRPLPELDFAGGRILRGPWGTVASSNITPAPSGISFYDQPLFLRAMRTGRVGSRQLNPIMLTSFFRNMTTEDLRAIYTYLRTLAPIEHRVDNAEAPTFCNRCGNKHGYGDRN